MLIFIENTPRAYAWGSRDALPELLGKPPTGEPQAELWLGTHPGSPANVAKATPEMHTLIDLVASDPDLYGVNGGSLPFLLKVLAIGAPLSLQVHPDSAQAREGFAREEAAGVPLTARDRNYGDPSHKPELLVALTEVSALSGFRPMADACRDVRELARGARSTGNIAGALALDEIAQHLEGGDPVHLRRQFMTWVFGDDERVAHAISAITALVAAESACEGAAVDEGALAPGRIDALRELSEAHQGDPGILVSLLLHLVVLAPGESIYLGARQLHAYLGGVAVEVMAASDNVLRAGLTEKHIDIDELCRVIDPSELAEPRFACHDLAPGLVAWRPNVPEFQLFRARVHDLESTRPGRGLPGSADYVDLTAGHPLVLIATAGHVRIERLAEEFAEVARVRRGQSLYISAGEPIRLTGEGEVFLATVGQDL